MTTANDIPDVLCGRGPDDRPVIAREIVRYVGEPVAAVAAEKLE